MSAVVDQPAPRPQPARPAAWDIVIAYTERRRSASAYGNCGIVDRVLADMRERDRVGHERYGTRLTSGNGRDHLVDAYQEALDLAAYLAAYLDEHGVGPETYIETKGSPAKWALFCVQETFANHIRTILRLRALIFDEPQRLELLGAG